MTTITPSPQRRVPATVLALLLASMLPGCGGYIDVPTVISSQISSTTAVTGTSATFTVVASGDALSYRWERSTDGGATWTAIAGATAPTYTLVGVTSAQNGQQFRVIVSGSGGSITSSAATLNVSPEVAAPAVSVQPVAQTQTAGASVSFSVTATGTSVTYQWQFSLDGVAWTNIAGAVTPTLTLSTVTLADNGRRYRALITNSAGSVTSNPVVLNVTPAPSSPLITTQPGPASVVVAQTATFVVAATGTPAPTYQWQQSTDGGITFTDIPNATGTSYTTPALVLADNGKRYRVRITNSAGTLTSAVVPLTVVASQAAPTFTLAPESQAVAVSGVATFSAAGTGSPSPGFQWRSGPSATTLTNINGATQSTYQTAAATLADHCRLYQVVLGNSAGSLASSPVYLTVTNPAPTPGALQPRLGGAAYYQPQLNVTIIANANLAATLPLGVAGINADGTMSWPTAKAWVQALNAAKYLGFSDWRLPKADPVNGCALTVNTYPSDLQGYQGKIDLFYNISASGTRYARSTGSELAYLYYNVLGGVPKYSVAGNAQNSSLGAGVPLLNLAPREYWTGQAYGGDGAAYVFHMKDGAQFGYVALPDYPGWKLNVMVVRTGDVAAP